MKAWILFICCLYFMQARARQLHTVADGDWESASVWFNQMLPDSVNDTIMVLHHISLHSNIILSTNDVLTIGSQGYLCGNDSLYMFDNARMVNYGFLGLYYWEQDGPGCYSGNIGTARIDMGQAGISYNGGMFLDSLACLEVHTGKQTCKCIADTAIFSHINDNIVTFELDSSSFYCSYFFGDGESATGATFYNVHRYADSGVYHVMATFYTCCTADTLFTTVHIDYNEPPPPPPPPPLPPPPVDTTPVDTIPVCTDNFAFMMGPDPADNEFTIARQFCTDEQGTIKVFAVTGQLVYSASFTTVSQTMTQTIPTGSLSSACYLIDVEAGSKYYRKRIMVIH